MKLDDDLHTNYFKDGQIWTNHLFFLNYIVNYAKETSNERVHIDFKWEI